MALEARAVRRGAPWADVRRTGMGPKRAAEYARTHDHSDAAAVVIAGFCGALDPSLQPGDLVLASELRGPDETVACADATILAGVLRRGGLRVHVAPVASERSLVTGRAGDGWRRAAPRPSTSNRPGWRRAPARGRCTS